MMIAPGQISGRLRLPTTGKYSQPRKAKPYSRRPLAPIVTAITVFIMAQGIARGGTVALTLSGATINGTSPSYSTGFGAVNGLGVGTPGAGITVMTSGVSGGALYSLNYNLTISGEPAPHTATVTAYVSTNFSKPTILILETCYPSSACSGASGFATLSTIPASPTPVIPSPGVSDGTYTASLGLFVASANGASSSGSDSATITFVATDTSNGKTSTVTLALNNPSENIQTAVGLQLATATGGLPVSPGADFAMNFGNVNGIGVGPGVGLSVVPAAGGVIYSTPYLIQPSFSGFSSTTASVEVYVSVGFAHPTILQLEDAAASGGPYSAISTSSAPQTSITASSTTGSSLTRYLGLFVSSVNGPTAFTGSDNATLTYTLTVP